MSALCRVPGCNAAVSSQYSTLCPIHKSNLRRHGHASQRGVTAAELRPHLASVRARIKKNRESPAWTQLERRWLTVVEHARGVVAEYYAGKAGYAYERKAANEVLKIAEAVPPRDVLEVVLAMFVFEARDPKRFVSDRGFRFQLVRRTRALADVNVGLSYDHETGRVRRVYREFPPKAVAILGQWLADALGVGGVHIAKLERAEEERRARENAELHRSLVALT